MAQLITWDKTGERFYQAGVDRGVLYPMHTDGSYPEGVAWNGLVSVSESPSGAEANPKYADNIKYLNLLSTEEFGFSIEAYTYPPEFALCDGSKAAVVGVNLGQQGRQKFGFSYRTLLGNDVAGQSLGYLLHLVYGCTASPSERQYQSINDSPEAVTFNWEIDSVPVEVSGYSPISTIVIDSTKADTTKLAALEVILYGATGTPNVDGRLPLPAEIITLMTPA